MDKSETYIKMRLAAREYMLDGKPPLLPTKREPLWVAPTVFVDDKGDFYHSTENEACQLERQDQLQEMFTNQDFAGYPVIRPDEPPLIDNLFGLIYFKRIDNYLKSGIIRVWKNVLEYHQALSVLQLVYSLQFMRYRGGKCLYR